jgi:hypothetical protein
MDPPVQEGTASVARDTGQISALALRVELADMAVEAQENRARFLLVFFFHSFLIDIFWKKVSVSLSFNCVILLHVSCCLQKLVFFYKKSYT